MRLFIYEFITGGGCLDRELPNTLMREGEMMLRALVSDLKDGGFDDLVCLRDNRLEKIESITNVFEYTTDTGITEKLINSSDMSWFIAPETENILYKLTEYAEQQGKQVLGCSSSVIKLATSKTALLNYLINVNIPCVKPILIGKTIKDCRSGWIVKPDDGVGGEGCYLFREQKLLSEYLHANESSGLLIQEYVEGIPASLSMVCFEGKATVLACNRQLFDFKNNCGHFSGVVVNGLSEYRGELEMLASRIANALPEARGYVGIDFVMTNKGPLVLELNPRLTTSYVGIRQSTGINPARYIVDSIMNQQLLPLNIKNHDPVTVSVN